MVRFGLPTSEMVETFWAHEIIFLGAKPTKENLLTCSPPTTDSKRKAGFWSDNLAYAERGVSESALNRACTAIKSKDLESSSNSGSGGLKEKFESTISKRVRHLGIKLSENEQNLFKFVFVFAIRGISISTLRDVNQPSANASM